MIVDYDIYRGASMNKLLGNLDIASTWSWIPAGMVVCEDYGRCLCLDCMTHNFSRMDLHGAHRPFPKNLVAHEPVLSIEEEHAKSFTGQMGHVYAESFGEQFEVRDQRSHLNFLVQDGIHEPRHIA